MQSKPFPSEYVDCLMNMQLDDDMFDDMTILNQRILRAIETSR